MLTCQAETYFVPPLQCLDTSNPKDVDGLLELLRF